MAAKYLVNVDLNLNQLLNAVLQNLATDPTFGNKGRVWYNTGTNLLKVDNGTSADTLTNILESISVGTANGLSVAAVSGKNQAISLALASGSAAGAMSAAHYSLVNGATSANTVSTLVQRDASGNFSAGTITAALSGTASNATQLNNQNASYYLSYANFTGTTTHVVISDFDTQVQSSRLDQMAAPTAAVSMNSQRLTNLADPTNAQDAATKNYVDANAAGYDTKASVRVATNGALPTNTYSNNVITASANAALTIDSVAVAAGDRVLVKDEATASHNGIYVVTNAGSGSAAWVLTRSSDANGNSGNTSNALNPGSFVFVEAGSANTATAWVMTTTGTITLGTTAINWAQVGSQSSYTAGNGLSLTGNQFSAVGTANRITVSGTGIDIASTYVGQTSITTLGAVATGTWNATSIAVAHGGTGATTATAARTNLGAVGKYNTTLATSATSYTVTHSLNTTAVDVVIQEVSSKSIVYADVTVTDANTVTVAFSNAPAANAYTVTVIG